MEDGLSEEHARHEVEEGKPAAASCVGGGGGKVLKHNSGAVGEEVTGGGGEGTRGPELHKLQLKAQHVVGSES